MTTKKPVRKEAEAGAKPNFEKSIERLEAIVQEMEGGQLSLDDMVARFEEGQGLLKFCTRKLNEVERKIEVLVQKGDEVVAEPFDAEGDAESDAGAAKKEDGSKELF